MSRALFYDPSSSGSTPPRDQRNRFEGIRRQGKGTGRGGSEVKYRGSHKRGGAVIGIDEERAGGLFDSRAARTALMLWCFCVVCFCLVNAYVIDHFSSHFHSCLKIWRQIVWFSTNESFFSIDDVSSHKTRAHHTNTPQHKCRTRRCRACRMSPALFMIPVVRVPPQPKEGQGGCGVDKKVVQRKKIVCRGGGSKGWQQQEGVEVR